MCFIKCQDFYSSDEFLKSYTYKRFSTRHQCNDNEFEMNFKESYYYSHTYDTCI